MAMRWFLATLLAIAAGGAAHLSAVGLMGVPPGLESQMLAALAGVMVGAGYEYTVRPEAEEE